MLGRKSCARVCCITNHDFPARLKFRTSEYLIMYDTEERQTCKLSDVRIPTPYCLANVPVSHGFFHFAGAKVNWLLPVIL